MTGERSQLAALPLDDKVQLLTGADSWRIPGNEALGLRSMVTSDGPSGVRGVALDESNPSSCLPCPSALGATWNPELVRELTAALGAEARAKGVDILLAPTINIMRTPLSGRGFECFSEDPELTARITVAYVTGVQSAGVAATVKHYVGNDSETERWTYDARIAEQVLREVYLVPFEAAVREAGAYAVMAAYNMVNGSRMTEHATLLREVLKREWGFSGLVTSDWDATRSTVPAAVGGLDLAMPGPNRFWGTALADAVRAGEVPEQMVDDKVARVLQVARWVGALTKPNGAAAPAVPADAATDAPPVTSDNGDTPPVTSDNGDAPPVASGNGDAPPAAGGNGNGPALVPTELLRRATAASFVLLHNNGADLPLDPAAVRSVALIGPNAVTPVIQGGGSARVIPASSPAPVRALRDVFGDGVPITTAAGCWTWRSVPEPPGGSFTDPVTGEPGVRLEFHTADGDSAEHRTATALAWWDGLPPGVGWGESGTITMRTVYHPQADGPYLLGASGVGKLSIVVDGTVVSEGETPVPADPVETMTRPGEIRGQVALSAGTPAEITVAFHPAANCQGPLALRLGITPSADAETLMAKAVTTAGQADVAIVVVGSAETSESEGYDRDTLTLPGPQDELVARVAAANPRTIVVVNAGMPVLMPWAGQVAAVLQVWLPGQAVGEALADVLTGNAEPGGRLPVTLPAAEADCPVLHAQPHDDRLDYAEGLLVGYRGYDAAGTVPLFPFGHGLGYTSWEYEQLAVTAARLTPGEDLTLRVTVRNTGQRPGREVVQAYVAGPDGRPGRPVRVLGAFAGVVAEPGAAAEVTLRVPARVFAVFDEQAGQWTWPDAAFTVQVGRSSRDLRLSATVRSG